MDSTAKGDNRTPIIAENLAIGYDGNPLTSGLDLELQGGIVTALLGSNGTGKSTLIKTLSGDLPAIEGRVWLRGRPVMEIQRKERARMLALVTTGSGMTGGLRVSELVELGRHPHTGYFGRISGSDREAVEAAMQAVGISHKRDSFVASLSDGERQKAMIARALAQECPVVIMDEPFSFLDVSARIEILRMLRDIAAERGTAILYSTHDVAQAMRMADYAWMFFPDRRFASGTPSALIERGDIDRLFDNPAIRFSRTENDFVDAR